MLSSTCSISKLLSVSRHICSHICYIMILDLNFFGEVLPSVGGHKKNGQTMHERSFNKIKNYFFYLKNENQLKKKNFKALLNIFII